MARPEVVLIVSGSIAAYKAVELARLLVQAGARVVPVLTAGGRRFVGAATLMGVTGERVLEDMWDPYPGEVHVDLARRADLVIFAPATADLLSRLASGRASDLGAAIALATRAPILLAPAMHPRMWEHPATARNVARVLGDGRVELVGPVEGEVASGEIGMGRMAEPSAIAEAAQARLAPRDLKGLRVVVTAGPTVEDLDAVRFLTNRSTGRMGFAVAERAARRGAEVTLIAGPTPLATPPDVARVDVRGALEMRGALWQALGDDLGRADVLVMSAAVSDYRPAAPSAGKVRRAAERVALELVMNPDLLAEVGGARTGARPVLVGFSVETEGDEAAIASARGKLVRKQVDLMVANQAAEAFGRDDNCAILVTEAGAEPLERLSKRALADVLLDRACELHRGGSRVDP